MRKSKERILSVVLTVVMVLSLFVGLGPVAANAQDFEDVYVTENKVVSLKKTAANTYEVSGVIEEWWVYVEVTEEREEGMKAEFNYILGHSEYSKNLELRGDVLDIQSLSGFEIEVADETKAIMFGKVHYYDEDNNPDAYVVSEVAWINLPEEINESASSSLGEETPSYPYGDEIVDLGDDSITMDEENILHFDIPENTGDYIYYPIVLPVDYLGMSAEDYIDMMEKAVGESVVDVPGTLSMDNVESNRLLENDYRTIYTINADISDGIGAIPEAVYMKSVVCLLKLHKDNYIMETYDSADDNEYFEGLSDVTSIYAVYGVHAELVTPTGSGVPADGALIDPIDVQVDWDKVPELEVGMNYENLAELEENPLTVTGTGIDEYVEYLWGVKLTEEHKITEDDEYYEELLEDEEWGLNNIMYYNENIDFVIEYAGGWTALSDILNNPFYAINENDTYGILVALCAQDGYKFGDATEYGPGYEYEGEVTGDLELVASVGFDSNYISLFFGLGTLAEMEEAKNPPVVEKPVISGQSESSSVKVGEKATFSVTATGEGVTYQWMIDRNDGKGFVVIANATGKTYTTSVVDIDCNGFKYKCVITNEGGSVETTPVTLKVTAVEENKDNDAAGDEGELEKDAQVAEDAPVEDAALNNTKEELLETGKIFTETEKQQIAEGADAKVWLEINKIVNVDPADKKKIEEKATSVLGESFNITYFDAKLFKQVGDSQAQTVSEPGMKIKVAIKLPATLINTDKTINREYKILRLHEGESQAEVISGTFDPATGEFTFETDKFSTYAIVYKDVPVESTTTNNNQKDKVPATGDNSNALYLFTLILIGGLGINFCSKRREADIKENI